MNLSDKSIDVAVKFAYSFGYQNYPEKYEERLVRGILESYFDAEKSQGRDWAAIAADAENVK